MMENQVLICRRLFTETIEATVQDAVDGFIHLELAGLSPATVRFYRTQLGRFCEDGDIGAQPLSGLDPVDLLSWQALVFARKQSPYSKGAQIKAVKRLFRWLFQRGVLPVNLAADLRLPHLPKGARAGISEANVERILAAAQGNPRDYALLRFLECNGARRGGAATLRWGDLDLERRRATITEKGEKTRQVPLSEAAMAALCALQEDQDTAESEPVFGLSATGVSQVLRRYKQRLGIREKVSPHQWRHRFARRAIQRGMDISQVAQLLGHESITVTERFYGQFTIDQLQQVYERIWD